MRLARISLLVVLALAIAGVVTSSAAALRFEEGDCRESGPGGIWICPTGLVNSTYRAQLQGAGGCGPDPGNPNSGLPYQYRLLSGSLPAGLTLSMSGLISGTPTAPGESKFFVELSDENPPSQSWCRPATSEREFQVDVLPALSVQQQSLQPTYLNEAYSFQLTAAGGGSQSWKIQSGTLPPGITLSTNGLLSGTPTAEGDFTFVVYVTDGTRSDIETLTLTVLRRLVATAPPASPAEVSAAFTMTVTATGGRAPYTWSVAGGSLPPGLTLDPVSGGISGTPTASGPYGATLSVKDALGLTATVNVAIAVAAKLALRPKQPKTAHKGKAYATRFPTVGGVSPKTYKLTGKVPGLTFNKSTGVLGGKPTKTGKFRLTVEVKDRLGAKTKRTYRLTVLA